MTHFIYHAAIVTIQILLISLHHGEIQLKLSNPLYTGSSLLEQDRS